MSYISNAFPVRQNQVNLEAGATDIGAVILCVEDGAVLVTWRDGGTDTIEMLAGQAIKPVHATSIDVVSGVFHGA